LVINEGTLNFEGGIQWKAQKKFTRELMKNPIMYETEKRL